jgi:transglutaminase-like putative cysteine protease
MRYRATHSTKYRYDASVSQCQSEVRLTPRALPWQALIESRIQATPEPASVEAHKDYFGNDVTTFTILESHDRFVIVSTSIVDLQPRPAPPTTDPAWEHVRDEIAAHARPDTLEAFEYVFDSPFVTTHAELAAYARPSFTPGRGLLAAVGDLTHRIHAEFSYKPNTTNIETPLLETLKARRGVCQDFSHVMIGALRALGLAARYVSGYLRSGADYQGAEASHAWVSVYLPGSGWIDTDPTNDVRPGTGHVILGWGRDYGDVTPVKGIALGGGHQLVDVEVRVEPLDGETSPRSNS